MADGSRKAISKVVVGDRVQARDPQTGERKAKTVLALFVHRDTLVKLRVGQQVLTTTVDHPFWSTQKGAYVRADQLARGDRVLGTDGRMMRVKGIEAGSGRVGTAYNLEVAGIHTCQVGERRRPRPQTRVGRRPRRRRAARRRRSRRRSRFSGGRYKDPARPGSSGSAHPGRLSQPALQRPGSGDPDGDRGSQADRKLGPTCRFQYTDSSSPT